MSKRTRMLRNESEQMSEKISKDGRKVLEDMTLYIRGVDISVYDQERVCRDITQMILDGEQRGDPASSVIGEDYKVFCDSVLEEIPRLTAGQKVMMTIRDMCGAMAVLSLLWGGLYLALSAGYGDLNSVEPSYTTVTSGRLLQLVIIAAAGTWFARIYYPNPYKSRAKLWLQYTVPAIIVVFISSRVAVILKQPLFTIHAVLLVPIAVILLIIYKIIDSRVA